jgi:hypothetical protein
MRSERIVAGIVATGVEQANASLGARPPPGLLIEGKRLFVLCCGNLCN